MAFTDLTHATYLCYGTMFTRWQAGTLKADLTAFCADTSSLFPDDNPNARTVGDWFVLIQAITNQLSAAYVTTEIDVFTASASTMYRMFQQTDARQSTGQISAGQAAAVLASANLHLD